MHVALILLALRDNDTVHCAIAPGGGKTAILLLLLDIVTTRYNPSKIYICTHNEMLVRQFKLASQQFGMEATMLVPSQLTRVVKDDHWLFVDEFIHSLMFNPVTVDKENQLDGILALPRLGAKRVLMSGMHAGQIGEMLTKMLKPQAAPAMLYQYQSQSEMAGQGATQEAEAFCYDTDEEMESGIIEWSQQSGNANHPLIVFGAQHLSEKLKLCMIDREIRLIDSLHELDKIQGGGVGIKTDICLMADEHALGIDVRFAVQPSTVIVVPQNEKLPSRYMFLQMAGRSQRDTDYPTCTIFSANGKNTEATVKRNVTTILQKPLGDVDMTWDVVNGERKTEIAKAVAKKQSRESEVQLRLCVDSQVFDDALRAVTGKKN